MLPDVALNSIIVIVMIIFPGLIVRRFYYYGDFSKQFIKGEWAERIVTSIFWGIVAQICSIIIFSYLPWGRDFVPNSVDISENKVKNIIINYQQVIDSRKYIIFTLSYILFSIMVSGIIGFTSYKLVRLLKLDVQIPSLRYFNHWHYLFKGELSKFNPGIPTKKVDFAWIDLTIKSEENQKTKLVQGVLCDYSFDATTGNLEYIYLQKARRFSNSINDFKNIPSDIFVIPFSNILDMNVRFKYKRKISKIDTILQVLIIPIVISFAFLPWILAQPNIDIWWIVLAYIPSFTIHFSIIGVLVSLKTKKWRLLAIYSTSLIISVLLLLYVLGHSFIVDIINFILNII